jgi:hypothetical protein
MNGREITQDEINEVMSMYAKGMMFEDIGKVVGRSRKSIEGIITRNRGKWTRDFNFPHITHARRFGA